MLNSKSIQGIIVLILGLFLSIWLGLSIVTNQTETILQIIAGAAFIICLALGKKIWLVLPFMAALGIQIRIPGQPSSLLLGQIIFLGFTILLFLMRKLPIRLKFTELEFWVLIVTLCVAQTYMRNPVGVNLFGGDTVGGKGYVLYAIALMSSLLFSGLIVSASDLKWILRISILGGLLNTALSIVGTFIPSIGYMLGQSYQKTDETNYENFGTVVDANAATRIGYLGTLGNNISLWISAYISPLRALVRPFWLVLMGTALASAMLSGFRNTVISIGLTFVLGITYRHGAKGFVLASFAAISGVALLAVANTIAPLPPNIQRALTILPGTWEERYKLDAAGSSEWRFEVWREVLLTNRWIQNKWLGDGLGFSAKELAAQMTAREGTRAGISGFEAHRESVLASGDYHSGPVSCIRVFGYVGLALFLLAQIRLAGHAHRQIIRCRESEWFPLALFIGIPLIYGPAFFVLVFGDFKQSAAVFLLSTGMIRLLENNLPLPAYAWRGKHNSQLLSSTAPSVTPRRGLQSA
jgi:hypothetical protein